MWTTYSPVARTLWSVSLSRPAPLVTVEKTRDGGFAPPALKKENGARFAVPDAESEETNAIGRGITQPVRRAYRSAGGTAAGSIWRSFGSASFTRTRSPRGALSREALRRLEPGVGIALVVVGNRLAGDPERMERVEHHRELLRLLRPDGCLGGPWMRSVRDPRRMERERADLDAAPAHEVPVHVVEHLVRIDVRMVVRHRQGVGVIVVETRHERADDEVAALEALVRRRRHVDAPGDRLEVLDVEDVGIEISI